MVRVSQLASERWELNLGPSDYKFNVFNLEDIDLY